MPEPPTIRPLTTHADYFRSEGVQRAIWQMLDNTQIVPLHVLITAQKNDGLVAAAFDPADQMIGFLFGFLGRTASKRLKHCSHMMGVLPALRRQGIGEALKRFQREYVLTQGIELITWTFDPLEGANAALNIGKLRTITRTYYVNLYDEMADSLNTGIPSDRFEVEWWLADPRVTSTLPPNPPRDAFLVNPTRFDAPHAVIVPGVSPNLNANQLPPIVRVEVPAVYQAIKQVSMELAREWRLYSRVLFQALFAQGYVVTDFISETEQGQRRNFYLLEQEPPIPDG